MIKPKMLKPGDTVALVSLSAGVAGDALFSHRVEVGKQRLENEFGLRVKIMPNAMKGIAYLDQNPQARADDLMDAFADDSIQAVITMIGGDDTIRLLPFINFDVLRQNPKVFMGYSDTTINHFMMQKAGLTSFYGPCVFVEFAENVAMHDYTKHYIQKVLFEKHGPLDILPSPRWTSEFLDWTDESNNAVRRTMIPDNKGYELLQGSGTVRGTLLGGCVTVFSMLMGTELWLTGEQWKDRILFLETTEDYPTPETLKYLLRGFAAQGIIASINGILFGKPLDEKYYEEYKEVLLKVIGEEAGRPDLPILYNMNFGHASPICILPCGVLTEIDCSDASFRLLEPAVE